MDITLCIVNISYPSFEGVGITLINPYSFGSKSQHTTEEQLTKKIVVGKSVWDTRF